uniref:Putative ovule protein n=1 Tax=Solanum chacoense TaxID=4108 RepID=A0A0V0GUC0_SOLCH
MSILLKVVCKSLPCVRTEQGMHPKTAQWDLASMGNPGPLSACMSIRSGTIKQPRVEERGL